MNKEKKRLLKSTRRRCRPTVLLLLLLLLLSFSFSACNGSPTPPAADQTDGGDTDASTDDGANTEDAMKGLFLNIDINTVTFPFLQAVVAKDAPTAADLYPFIDQYKDSQVTDVAICIFNQVSMTPSDEWTDILDKYDPETDPLKTTSYSKLYQYDVLYNDLGIDPYAVWFARCREVGLTSWLSMRMNDCHGHETEDSWILSDEYFEAKANGWQVGAAYGYQGGCLDYGVKEVRDGMLAYIKEQLSRYDVDGFELDFSREWVCFDYINNPDCYLIMNQFLRDVKAIVEGAEAKWGHDVKINIRLVRDIEHNKVYGFDVDTMVSEKLVDSLTVCPRWTTNDSNLPIAEWKERYPNMPIYAGITDQTFRKASNYETLAGYAAAFLADGADKIYLYNMFLDPNHPNKDNGDVHGKVHDTCGSLDTLMDKERHCAVTFEDLAPLPRDEHPPFGPFPHEFNGFRSPKADGFSLEIPTGPAGERDVYFILGLNRALTEERLTVEINDYPVDLVGPADPDLMKNYKAYFSEHLEMDVFLYCYRLPARVAEDSRQTVTLAVKDDTLTVRYMEFVLAATEAPLA